MIDVLRVGGVVLAAGASRRMGRNKMLEELDGEPLARRAARRAVTAGLSPVVVVVGRDASRVREALADLAVAVEENPDFTGPTSGSLHRGLGCLPADVAGAVVVLGDMVNVTDRMLGALAKTARRTGAPLISSRYDDVVAPPLFLRRELFDDIRTLTGEGVCKALVSRYRNRTVFVDWPASCLADVDTPEDLERVAQAAREC